MRVFVAGASGAIGTRLVPQLIDRRARGDRHPGRPGAPNGCARSAPSRSRSICSTRAPCARPCSRPSPTRSSTRRPLWRTCASPGTSTAASRRPTGCGPRAPTRCWPPRARRASRRFVAQSFASLPLRARGRAGQDRGRPARPHPAGVDARDARRDAPSRRGGHRRRRDRASLRRLLRRRQRRADRACAQAAVPDRRRRRRRLLVRSTSTTRLQRPCSRSNTTARRSTTSSTTSPPRCANGCPCWRTRSAPSRPVTSRSGSRG